MTVYPNPSYDNINVDLAGFEGQVNLLVYNLLGEKVADITTSSQLESINVEDFPTGNYMIHILNSHKSTQQKFSVVH